MILKQIEENEKEKVIREEVPLKTYPTEQMEIDLRSQKKRGFSTQTAQVISEAVKKDDDREETNENTENSFSYMSFSL